MAIKRPQLDFQSMQQLRWLLGGVLTLLAIGTVLYLDVNAWGVSVLAIGGTVACLWRPDLPARVPPLAHKLVFPAIVIFFLGDLWWNAELLPAMVRLDILLLGYRGVTYRQRRDDLQVIVLGLFLVVVAGVLTVSITFAGQILAFVGCALGLLLVLTMTDAMRGTASVAPAEKYLVPGWAEDLDWRALARRVRAATDVRVVVAGGILFVGVVGVAVLLFLAIPRFQLDNSLFLERFIFRKARTGFNDSIKFGDVTDITQDTSIAVSVDISDRAALPPSPYWRMMLLDDYANGTFKLSQTLRAWSDTSLRTGQSFPDNTRGATVRPATWTFYLEAGISRALPLAGHFNRITFRERQNLRWAANLGLVELINEPAVMTAYKVEDMATEALLPDQKFLEVWRLVAAGKTFPKEQRTFPSQVGFPKLSDDDVRELRAAAAEVAALQLTPNSPRLLTIGKRQKSSTPVEQFAQKAILWLRMHHRYALSPSYPKKAGDPLINWLSSNSPGHCELFAGSLVMLARASNFPARVVTGFKGGTWNNYSNSLTIRNSDAHAWAEIFDLENGGWIRADALSEPETTNDPAQAATDAQAARTDRSWTARLESLRVFWYRRIVNFDQQSQADTIEAVKGATQSLSARLQALVKNLGANLRDFIRGPWDFNRALKFLTGAFAVVVFVWAAVQTWQGAWNGLRKPLSGRRLDPVRREAGRWLSRFDDLGAGKRAAPRVQESLQRIRFGAEPTWPDPHQTFRAARREWKLGQRRKK